MNSRLWLSGIFSIVLLAALGFLLSREKTPALPPTPENVVLPTVTITEPDLLKAIEKADEERKQEQESMANERVASEEIMKKGDVSGCTTLTHTGVRTECE
jgi:hypothetical protein